jgi:hypothetical protein
MLVLFILSVPLLLCVLFLLAVSQRSGNALGVQPRGNANPLPPRPTQRPPTRVALRDEPRGHRPSGRPVDWAAVDTRGIRSAVRQGSLTPNDARECAGLPRLAVDDDADGWPGTEQPA